MFIAGIGQGVAKGTDRQTQMLQLKEEKARREKQDGMQEKQFNAQMQQLTMKNQMMEMKLGELGNSMLRDGSYENIEKWMSSPKDNKLQNEYLQATYVQNDTLNKQMSRKLGMREINDVTFDHENARLQFKDNKTGQVVEKPLDIFLGEIGYFTKADAIQKKQRAEKYEETMNSLGLKQAEANIASTKASTRSANASTSASYARVRTEKMQQKALLQQEKTAEQKQQLWKDIVDLAETENADPTLLGKTAMEIKYDKNKMASLGKDKLYTDTNTHLSLYDGANDLKKEVETLANGIMNDPVGTVEKLAANTAGYTMSDEKKEQIMSANTLAAKLRLLTMDYLQYKSGAAFGEVELKEYEKVAGIANFTDPAAAKSYMSGFVTYLGERAKSKITEQTSADGKVLLKDRLHNIDKYSNLSIGSTFTSGGQTYQVTGWSSNGKPKVKPVKAK